MKILYIAKYPLEDEYVLKIKFDGEMNAFRNLGHDVFFIAYDHKYTYLFHNGDKQIIKKIRLGSSKIYVHTKAFYDLYDSVIRVLKNNSFDIAYFRLAPLSLVGIKMCAALHKRSCKIVVEIPTYPLEKIKDISIIRKMYLLYSNYCWSIVRKKIQLFVLIGDKANEYCGIPAINIDNGINVDTVSIRQPTFDKERIHLLAVASMSDWQGYDRIIKSIALMNSDLQNHIVFHMIGPEGDGSLAKWKNMVNELNIGNIVLFHGTLTGTELDPYFDLADIGICTLGLYRKGLNSASILKLREYSARGLPFVYAATDPAMNSEEPFCLHVSNDDSLIDMQSLIEFANNMRNSPEMPDTIRLYAKKHMSWDTQMLKVLNMLETIQ